MLPDFFPFYVQGSKDSIVVDSAVLTLKFAGFYGDSSKPLKMNLHQIDPSTPLDIAKYYPANYPELYGIKAGASMANPITVNIARLGDSIINRYEASQYQIRIKLLDKYARMFIKEFDSTNAYKNDTTLRQFFPGFALTVDPSANKNVLLKLNMTDTNTRLALPICFNTSDPVLSRLTKLASPLADNLKRIFKTVVSTVPVEPTGE